MRIIIIFTLLTTTFCLSSQKFTESKHKVKFYNYCEFNKRISTICSSENLDVTISNFNDSIFNYESLGYFGVKLRYDRYTRELYYSNNFFDESSVSIRDYFIVKDIDFKNFKHENDKILVYRFLITNTKVDDGDIIVFFTKEYSIILQKLLVTNGLIRYEFAEDLSKNTMLNHLYAFILSDNEFSHIQNWTKIIEE